ncbi:hypothetical protein PDE_05028 [Penicillium oxalicum 114-2]|uniref:Uncharacterized protein n=1 Tax=Penicillium oxalicum (strain 114-2 / CGMCC 5302) TaxID=933388 RepID=S8AV39_PENO1|nr:hypothetical protein PDE_05028 [Penicillium oxalicum 114-2]
MAYLSDQGFFLDGPAQLEEWVDFDQFLNLPVAYGDEYSALAATDAVLSEAMVPQDSEAWAAAPLDFSQSAFADMIDLDMSQDSFFASLSPEMNMMTDLNVPVDNSTLYTPISHETQLDFRQMVEAQAAADPRITSMKQKRREAGIELHLQRLYDATARELDLRSDSTASFSSPMWSDYAPGSISPQSASASASPKTPSVSAPTPATGAGGIEMVLDLNMNAAANLPKKQKPRSQAQKENYIKARKYGACEKHKKQHKRCNCLEKAGVHLGASDVPLNIAYKQRSQQQSHLSGDRLDLQVSVTPGHDRQSARPSLQVPVTVQPSQPLKALSTNKPGHERKCVAAAVVSPSRPTAQRTDSVLGDGSQPRASGVLSVASTGVQPNFGSPSKQHNRGVSRHAPQHVAPVAITPVREAAAKYRTSCQSGTYDATNVSVQTGSNVSSPQDVRASSSSPQTVSVSTRRAPAQPNLRWHVAGTPVTAKIYLQQGGHDQSNPIQSVFTVTPSMGVRRSRETLSSHRAGSRVLAMPQDSLQRRALQVHSQLGPEVGNRGRISNNHLESSRVELPKSRRALSTNAGVQMELSPQDNRPSASASKLRRSPDIQMVPLHGVVRTVITQADAFMARIVSTVAGIGLSSVSSASWLDRSVGHFLSSLGGRLMAARMILGPLRSQV